MWTIIICLFHQLSNKPNSSQKPTTFPENSNPFSIIKPIVVWVKISEKSIHSSGSKSPYYLVNRKKLVLPLEEYFKT